jgi:hypothetical protein
MNMTTETAEAPARTLRARAGSLFPADNRRNFWALDLPADAEREDLERPSFWSHEAAKMKAGDRVEARWEHGQKWADLLVMSSSAGAVRMHIIHFMEQDGAAADEPGGDLTLVEVKWRGPTAKFSVIRLSDSMLIKDGFADKIDAMKFARDYEKTITR